MKKILLVLIISLTLINYGKSINQNQLESKNTKAKISFKNKKVIAYCENGKVIYKGNYKNGKKDGEWITYDKNGSIKFKTNYKDGKNINYDTMSRFSHSNE